MVLNFSTCSYGYSTNAWLILLYIIIIQMMLLIYLMRLWVTVSHLSQYMLLLLIIKRNGQIIVKQNGILSKNPYQRCGIDMKHKCIKVVPITVFTYIPILLCLEWLSVDPDTNTNDNKIIGMTVSVDPDTNTNDNKIIVIGRL